MTKICKYCGNEYKGTGADTCANCCHKKMLMPRFEKARDKIRRSAGLPPLSGDNSAIEFANRLRKRVKGVGIHNAIDCVLLEMLNE